MKKNMTNREDSDRLITRELIDRIEFIEPAPSVRQRLSCSSDRNSSDNDAKRREFAYWLFNVR